MEKSKPHKRAWFRAFVTIQYYENRDEYDSVGQRQPYTFEQYVSNNICDLKAKFRLTKYK